MKTAQLLLAITLHQNCKHLVPLRFEVHIMACLSDGVMHTNENEKSETVVGGSEIQFDPRDRCRLPGLV